MSAKFIRARRGPHDSVIYTTTDGKEFQYSKGDLSWRMNNPGDLWSGPVSKRNGEIGKYRNFAFFPDYNAGHAALLDSLSTTYWNKSLAKMFLAYAPKTENNTNEYLQFLRSKTGVKDNRKIKDFTPGEFEKLWRAIEQYEGSHSGKIEPFQTRAKITEVRKNKKGTVIAYCVDGIGWVSKAQGIALARKGKIDAVVATSRSGKLFLRTRPGTPVEVQLLSAFSSDLSEEDQTRAVFRTLERVNEKWRCSAVEWLGFVPIYRAKVGNLCVVEKGVRTHVNVDPGELFARILAFRPDSFLLFHNHPSGNLEASKEDHNLTRRVDEISRQLGVKLAGHFIVSGAQEREVSYPGYR